MPAAEQKTRGKKPGLAGTLEKTNGKEPGSDPEGLTPGLRRRFDCMPVAHEKPDEKKPHISAGLF